MQLSDPKFFRFNHYNEKIRSKFDKSMQECLKRNFPYIDPKFPPQSSWRTPEIFLKKDQIKLFHEISPYNIIQGTLGDCYLMGSLIVLSENPQNIKKLFVNNDFNEFGLYGIWICESGSWRLLMLDSNIPCSNSNTPCYARAKNNELWVMLLEKAYAKAYLGYKNIILGFSGDALKDLTGAPSEYIDLKEDKKAWDMMITARKNNFVLCASSKTNNDELDDNLISKHNYAILALKEISKKELWLKLQNPLQGFSWKNQAMKTLEVEKELEIPENEKLKGIFWIDYKDFRENFEVVTCNKIHPNYLYSFLKIPNDKNHCFIRVIVMEKGHCYFSIHQKHSRVFKETKEKYNYSLSRIIVCRIEQGCIIDVIGGDFSTKQSTFFDGILDKNEYLIYGEIDFIQDFYKNFTISTYSEMPVVLDLLGAESFEMDKTEILTEFFRNYLEKNKKLAQISSYDQNGEILKYNGTLWGYVYFLYTNRSQKMSLYEAVTLTKCENLKKFWPKDQKNNDYFEVICSPSESKLILYQIGVANNGSHACSMNSLVNLMEDLDDKTIIEYALKEGVNNKRTNEVSIYNYKFKGGTALVYQNKGKADFKENLMFKVLENLEIKLEKGELKGTSVQVKVEPNSYFVIKLKIKNPFIKKSGFNYSIN